LFSLLVGLWQKLDTLESCISCGLYI
jgi:hypothetical protein